jgi:Protein of unknown function (DUF2934)
VDSDTRRKKQQALMTEALERKIRLHAQRLYDERGQTGGSALEDWVQAESEVLGNSILEPLYRRSKGSVADGQDYIEQEASKVGAQESVPT